MDRFDAPLPAGQAGEDPGGAPGGVQAGDAVHDFLGDGGSAGVVGVEADPQHLGGVRELDSAGAGQTQMERLMIRPWL